MSFCNVTCVGRLVRDPESKQVGGHTVVKGCVAFDKFKPDANGDKGCFLDFDAWGKSADFLINYGSKGRLVAVSGRLESRKHDDKVYWTLKADNVSLLDRPRDDAPAADPLGEYDPFASDE
jgi:single-strand DNA-binding protein